VHALLHLLLLLASPLNTPKRFGAGQTLHTEGAQGTASGTRRAWDKLISVFSFNSPPDAFIRKGHEGMSKDTLTF
jgi:hypothetical protein